MKKKKETTIRVHQEFGIPDAVHDSIDAQTNDAGEISLKKVMVMLP
mgnify:CR=1 FL=1